MIKQERKEMHGEFHRVRRGKRYVTVHMVAVQTKGKRPQTNKRSVEL